MFYPRDCPDLGDFIAGAISHTVALPKSLKIVYLQISPKGKRKKEREENCWGILFIRRMTVDSGHGDRGS